MDNVFNLLSNEVISCLISFLDATSFFQFCGCSRALHEFSQTTNDNWRIFYSIEWYVDDAELVSYDEEDWREIFMQRFIAEKSLYRRYKQHLAQHNDTTQNQPQNDTPDELVELHVVERTIGDLLVFARDPTLTPSTAHWSEIAASLDVFTHFPEFESEATPLEVTVTAIARLLRLDWGNLIRNADFSQKLGHLLTALDKYIKQLKSPKKRCIGLVSILSELIKILLSPGIIETNNFHPHQIAVGVLNYVWNANDIDPEAPEYHLMARKLGIIPRAIEIYERISDPRLDLELLALIRISLRKSCEDAALLIRRPEFIKKLKKRASRQFKDALTVNTNAERIAVVSNIADIDPDYAASEGLMDLLIDAAYHFDDFKGVENWVFMDILMGLGRFCHSMTQRIKIASNSTLLNSLMSLLHRRANSLNFKFSDCASFFTFFRFLCCKDQSMAYIFDDGYLDQLMPYVAIITDENTFLNMCDIMGFYIGYGIENLRMESVVKTLEPHLQTIIKHKFVKQSVSFWQAYICGMPMPREIAKSLVQRIIPEIPLETDLRRARSYAELLANILQSDHTALLDMNIQPVFEHFALKLLLDEERKSDTNNRGRIPYPICFLSAAVCLPQAAQLAIKNDALLNKMNMLCRDTELTETIYMVTHFYSHLVKLEGWNNTKGLKILARFGGTMPLDAEMYFLFTFIEPYSHLFLRDNPVEMVLFGSWMVARMSRQKEGRLGLKKLSSDVIEWLSGHSDMRIRKNMNHYHQNMELYDI